MQTGIVEANLVNLNREFNLSYIDDLISLKLEGAEKSVLEKIDIKFYQQECDRLQSELEKASLESHLPETSSAKPALNDLLVRLRMQTV